MTTNKLWAIHDNVSGTFDPREFDTFEQARLFVVADERTDLSILPAATARLHADRILDSATIRLRVREILRLAETMVDGSKLFFHGPTIGLERFATCWRINGELTQSIRAIGGRDA